MNQAESRKIQRQRRLKDLVVPNDLLSKHVMHLTDAEFQGYATTKVCQFDEKIKRKTVLTQFWFELIENYTDLTPPDEFDFDVLIACMSAKYRGFDGLTFNEIARLMAGGKDVHTKLRPEQKARIFRAVNRLMSVKLHVNLTQLFDTGKYPEMPKSLTAMLLPCKILDGVEFNGQRDCTVVRFLDESPLMTVAKAKSQLLTIPVALLDVPNLHHTELVTKIKNYVTRRVYGARPSKGKRKCSPPIIRFACIFENVGIADADRWKRQDARKIVADVFEHLKAQNVIREFEFEQLHGEFRAVKFKF